MQQWFKLYLPREELYNQTTRLITEFLTYYQRGMQGDAAVIAEYLTDGINIYFSPVAANLAGELISSYDAQPCESPFEAALNDKNTLSFLAGDIKFYKKYVLQ